MEIPSIDSITIENFRGFGERQRIDISGSAVIVFGPNGTGKTSFFDSILWLLLGRIPRFERLPNAKEMEYVTNRFSGKQIARVSAEIRVAGERLSIARRGSSHENSLELYADGRTFQESEAQFELERRLGVNQKVGLESTLLTSGILQQENLRAVIEGDQQGRYMHLIQLLGLDSLPTFEENARSRLKELRRIERETRARLDSAQKQLSQLDDDLKTAQQKLDTDAQISELEKEFRQLVADQARWIVTDMSGRSFNAELLSELANDARRIRERASAALSNLRRYLVDETRFADFDLEGLERTDMELHAAEEALNKTNEVAAQVRSELGRVENATGKYQELVSLALPLLNEKCPVCGQDIDVGRTKFHLESSLESITRELMELRVHLDELTTLMATHRERVEALRSRRKQEEKISAEYSAWVQTASDVRASLNALVAPVGALQPSIQYKAVDVDVEAISELRSAADEYTRRTAELAASMASRQASDHFASIQSRVQALRLDVETLTTEVKAAGRRAREAEVIASATTRAIAKVIEQRLSAINPIMSDIYSRLDPHPIFREIGYSVKVHRQRGHVLPEVFEGALGQGENPLAIFSSSQANVAALSVFLAMGWTSQADAFPFLLLDDPLQAMDDINILGFADLCRHLRRKRQLLISTHDRRIWNLLERKLAPREADVRTRVIQFLGWDRGGPQIRQYDVESQEDSGDRRVLTRVA